MQKLSCVSENSYFAHRGGPNKALTVRGPLPCLRRKIIRTLSLLPPQKELLIMYLIVNQFLRQSTI